MMHQAKSKANWTFSGIVNCNEGSEQIFLTSLSM
jgi:hypothetical protein